ncbi:MAG TPA: TauD/TfdA family dioxygenase [Steroidobacteraceae bacterium]|nr:TauD/TfdA family dioxygenase [Steroidobacteraceae bacterium]
MPLSLYPLTESLAAEIGDVDLRGAPEPQVMEEIRSAFARYAVLVFPAQRLDAQQHMAFAANFGPLEKTVDSAMKRGPFRVDEQLADVANLDAGGRLWQADSRQRIFNMMGNRLWHTDSSFNSPAGYMSMLYARSIAPVGGNTEFTDLRAAWDSLAAELKARVRGLRAEHSILHSRRKLGIGQFTAAETDAFAPVLRPLVRTLPESGRTSLYLASHIGRIEGLGEDEARELLEALTSHATQPQFRYAHRWRIGDLVMWDNRCTMHRGMPFDDLRWPRDLQRATTSDRPDAFGAPDAARHVAEGY